MRRTTLILMAVAGGCVVHPNTGDHVGTYEPIEVNGYASDPGTQVNVELMYQPTGQWVVVSTATSSQLQLDDERLYEFTAFVDMSQVWFPDCYYNPECQQPSAHDKLKMRVSTPGASLVQLQTFDENWFECISATFTGSYIEAGFGCIDDDSPVLSLSVDECETSADCDAGFRCAKEVHTNWENGVPVFTPVEEHVEHWVCAAPCDPLDENTCAAGTQCDSFFIADEGPSYTTGFLCGSEGLGQVSDLVACWSDDSVCPDGPCSLAILFHPECGGEYTACCTSWCDPTAPDCDADQFCEPIFDTGVGYCRSTNHP